MRHYEVLVSEPGLLNGVDGYLSLGVYRSSSRRAAANLALRAVAEDPFDSEGAAILSPDPSIVVVPLRHLVPLEGLRVPPEIAEAFENQ